MIAVVGGTGTLGRLLVPRLLARGETVTVVARHVDAGRVPAGAAATEADVMTDDGASTAVAGARVVVSAITGFAAREGVDAIDAGANRRLAAAARVAGVEHVVLLSVAQAAADHPIPLFRAKWAAEEAVRASGVAWTIVRPTAYLETWLGLVGGPLASGGKAVVFGSGRNPINFVSAADVAATVDRVIEDPSYRGRVVEVPGPEDLTLEDLLAVARRATGSAAPATHVPRPLMRLLSVALRPVNATRAGQVTTALAMDTRPMTGDPRGRSIRDIPMTRAADVAARLFPATARAGAAQTQIRQSGP
jgi:uncharacterized protein YbjT (DUF2867 family)